EFAVAVEVRHGGGNRISVAELGGAQPRKTAVTVAQHHAGVAVRGGVIIATGARHHSEVKLAVGVEIAHDHGPHRTERDAGGGGLEGAVAIAQEYAQVPDPGGYEVELAVAVEVADRYRQRVIAVGVPGRLERAIRVA